MSFSKQKGTKFETDIVNYLNSTAFSTARRVVLSGASGDRGDIWLGTNPVLPDLVIECKNYAKEPSYKLVEDFIKEAHTEYLNATNSDHFDEYMKYRALLIVKRPNLGVADSWLIYKNIYNITVRVRLGDVIDYLLDDNTQYDNNEVKENIKILTLTDCISNYS